MYGHRGLQVECVPVDMNETLTFIVPQLQTLFVCVLAYVYTVHSISILSLCAVTLWHIKTCIHMYNSED